MTPALDPTAHKLYLFRAIWMCKVGFRAFELRCGVDSVWELGCRARVGPRVCGLGSWVWGCRV